MMNALTSPPLSTALVLRRYETIEAIPEDRVVIAGHEQEFLLGGRVFQSIYTEGHARHHYCIADPATKTLPSMP